MSRTALTDESGRWFDSSKAQMYKEDTYWNGSNHVGKITKSQFVHEAIFITASGKLILARIHNYDSSKNTYEIIDEETAAVWFARQELPDSEIPEFLLEYIKDMEIE